MAALNVLRRQLQQANKDVETLYTLKQEALDHPFQFLTDLKDKVYPRDEALVYGISLDIPNRKRDVVYPNFKRLLVHLPLTGQSIVIFPSIV